MKNKGGTLLIVSGPSGSGKTSLCCELLKHSPKLKLSISATTRPPRPRDECGKDYFFLSQEDFDAEKQNNAFLECAFVHGNWYGTRTADVDALLADGFDVLLEIDWQGAKQVAEQYPDACRIFIIPPSIEALRERLTKRQQDHAEVIERRVKVAEDEMAHACEAGFCIVNDNFDDALRELTDIYRNCSDCP